MIRRRHAELVAAIVKPAAWAPACFADQFLPDMFALRICDQAWNLVKIG